jgi:anthranilate synthase component 1
MSFRITPSLEEFSAQRSGGRVVPVWAEIVSDVETPISAFAKLGSQAPSFLFESAEINDLVGRYSFVGCGERLSLRGTGKTVTVRMGDALSSYEVPDDPLSELQRLMEKFPAVSHPELPGCWGGAVGFLSYDGVRWIEPVLKPPPTEGVGAPDCFFVIPEITLIFDHRARRFRIVSAVLPEDGPGDASAYEAARERIANALQKLQNPVALAPLHPEELGDPPSVESNTRREDFQQMVENAKEFIRAGDIFQIVLSQRFETPFAGDALDLYRALRFINPSPYMFCMRCGDGLDLVGSSPEVHVRLTGDLVEIRPIAGTRKRGRTPQEDAELAEDLLADEKERAEHLMLVDLARNDVGRIAQPGSVEVRDFMTIERYSHVMHIVTHVTGQLAGGRNAFDVMRATFPAGTVSGAPKVRAMQIINEMERSQRGVYSGAVGYFRFDGDSDSCIALRTIVMKDGVVYVQAGAGVVADSTPEGEYQETVNKARAALRAVTLANSVKPSRARQSTHS